MSTITTPTTYTQAELEAASKDLYTVTRRQVVILCANADRRRNRAEFTEDEVSEAIQLGFEARVGVRCSDIIRKIREGRTS